MKTLTLSLVMLFCVTAISTLHAQAPQNGPEITFEKLVHNFGELIQGDPAEYAFKFTNTGKQPLILSDVRSSCGCTVPTWPRNPILPGASEVITVKYNSNIVGQINKQVTITSNAANSPTVIRITGNISKMPSEVLPFQQQTSAPVNK